HRAASTNSRSNANAPRMHMEKPNGADKSSAQAPPPTAHTPTSETVRRTRGAALPTRSRPVRKANSHANGSANHAAGADNLTKTRQAGSRVNGHGHAFSADRVSGFVLACAGRLANPEINSIEAPSASRSLEAGSDDVSGASVAMASVSAEPGADRDAYA